VDRNPPLRADLDFRPVATERSLPPVVDPASYRRMIFNPFLGIFAVAGWLAALREVVLTTFPDRPGHGALCLLFLSYLATLLPRFFQFHCLDCGRTGRLSRWKRHVCPAIARRILEGRPLRFRGPGPLAQMLFWGYLLAGVLVIVRLSGLSVR
jgi:hypothetical protein